MFWGGKGSNLFVIGQIFIAKKCRMGLFCSILHDIQSIVMKITSPRPYGR
jgi:hypothetical protein